MVTRVGGALGAGNFALTLAIATPLVTVANWGLRNGYITLRRRYPFSDFALFRGIGVLLSSAAIMVAGLAVQPDAVMVVAVVLFKAADSMLDLLYGRLQRAQQLAPFGMLMVLNGVVTASCAVVFGVVGATAAGVVSASSIGSIATLVVAAVYDRAHLGQWTQGRKPGAEGIGGRLWLIAVGCWEIVASQVLAVAAVSIPIWAVALFGGTDEVARFAAAAYMISLGSILGSSLNSTVIGRYQNLISTGRANLVVREARQGGMWVTIAGLTGVIIVGLAGPGVFSAVYGAAFSFSATELMVVAFAAILSPGSYLMNAALLALNSYRAQLYIVALGIAAMMITIAAGGLIATPGFMVGAGCALVGEVARFVASGCTLRRADLRASGGG